MLEAPVPERNLIPCQSVHTLYNFILVHVQVYRHIIQVAYLVSMTEYTYSYMYVYVHE